MIFTKSDKKKIEKGFAEMLKALETLHDHFHKEMNTLAKEVNSNFEEVAQAMRPLLVANLEKDMVKEKVSRKISKAKKTKKNATK